MLIINSTIITWGKPNEILHNHAIRISDSIIQDIGFQKDLLEKYSTDEILDAKGQFLMPGLICAHTHFYGAFSRGMNIHGSAPADFPEILQKLWWPLDQSLTNEDIKYSSLVSMVDAIKHGTTTLFDHHASPNSISGSLDIIEEAFRDTGLRGVVCYEVTDRGGYGKADEGIAENVRMIQKVNNNKVFDNKVSATFGLHASLTISEETLKKCRSVLPDNFGIHIHVAEHSVDEYDSIIKTGLRVIDRLDKHELLGENSIVVHGVHMDMREIAQVVETKTWVTHQPRSNMNNAVGMADIDSMIRMGVKVCMGNDGFSNAMWDEWRTCYLAHKLWNQDPRRMNGSSVIDLAVYNNSDLATHFFNGSRIGKIEIGAKADLILVDYTPITEVSTGNLPWQILFGFRDSMVTTTIVDGKLLMKDRQLVFLDEQKISSTACELSKEVWKRYERQF
ncbi:MAG: hydrolase [Chlorobiaceae bacterium]|nr:MAG: putative hydrolase [Chloroflexota bacterium]MBA4311021.1 hydrolase [Chlorobiaceae bacterium]